MPPVVTAQVNAVPGILLFILIGAAVIAGVAVFLYFDRKRREAMADVAHRLGLTYTRHDSVGILGIYGDTDFCNRGRARKASNVLFGPLRGGEACAFDYKYTVGSGKNQHTYHKTACAYHVPYHLAALAIRPENFLDKAAAFMGFDDIDLDNAEFNNRFHVKSPDKKFAYDMLTQRTMEYVLGLGGVYVEMRGNYALFHYEKRLSADALEQLILAAAGFFQYVPEYMKADRAIAPRRDVDSPPLGGAGMPQGGVTPTERARRGPTA